MFVAVISEMFGVYFLVAMMWGRIEAYAPIG